MRMKKKAIIIICVVLLLSMVAAACGAAKDSQTSPTAEIDKGTRTFEHILGKMEVPAHSQRVIGLFVEDEMSALGVKPRTQSVGMGDCLLSSQCAYSEFTASCLGAGDWCCLEDK